MVGILEKKYDKRIIKSIIVKYDNFGRSLSTMKVYAINESKHTILTVKRASISFGLIQKTLQDTNKMIISLKQRRIRIVQCNCICIYNSNTFISD